MLPPIFHPTQDFCSTISNISGTYASSFAWGETISVVLCGQRQNTDENIGTTKYPIKSPNYASRRLNELVLSDLIRIPRLFAANSKAFCRARFDNGHRRAPDHKFLATVKGAGKAVHRGLPPQPANF